MKKKFIFLQGVHISMLLCRTGHYPCLLFFSKIVNNILHIIVNRPFTILFRNKLHYLLKRSTMMIDVAIAEITGAMT